MSKGLNWKEATRAQLHEIAFKDDEARLEYRFAATAEIKRRNRIRYRREQHKIRAVFPR